jgi:hypothetical protein
MNFMSKLIYVLSLVVLFYSGIVSSKPVLLYSDLTAAPNSGWSSSDPEKGAVITVWGSGFGTGGNSETNFISVNGHNLQSSTDYLTQWGEYGKPVRFLQRIVFQLNENVPSGDGEITLTVGGWKSNKLNFYVNDGRIFFTDVNETAIGLGTLEEPWSRPEEFLRDVQPGDILYFREGIYSERYTGGKSTIWIRENKPSGTENAPIAFVGYPGEVAIIDSLTSGSSSFKQGIKIEPAYYTVANLKFESYSNAVEVADYSRVVGNDAQGGTVIVDGTGIIVLRRNGSVAFGNTVHGGRSENRLDHGIYITGCAPEVGNELGWNHVYDNSFDRGPLIVVNHQGTRCSSDVFLKSHYIYNNFVDCSVYPSRGIGLFDLSWDGLPETEPEPTYVYGNIVLGCGFEDLASDHTSVYQAGAHGRWYNNSIIDSRTRGVSIGGLKVLSSEFSNNIVTLMNPDDVYINVINSNISAVVESNLFFGGSKGIPVDAQNSLESDPKIQIDAPNATFEIDFLSPGIDIGQTALPFYHYDIVGNDRVINGAVDIGALEFLVKPEPPSGLAIQ